MTAEEVMNLEYRKKSRKRTKKIHGDKGVN